MLWAVHLLAPSLRVYSRFAHWCSSFVSVELEFADELVVVAWLSQSAVALRVRVYVTNVIKVVNPPQRHEHLTREWKLQRHLHDRNSQSAQARLCHDKMDEQFAVWDRLRTLLIGELGRSSRTTPTI